MAIDYSAPAGALLSTIAARASRLDDVLTREFQQDGFVGESRRYGQLVRSGELQRAGADAARAATLLTSDTNLDNDPFAAMVTENIVPIIARLEAIGPDFAFDSVDDGGLAAPARDAFDALDELRMVADQTARFLLPPQPRREA